MKLTARINTIKPSPTLAITMKANALRAEGRDIIGFGAGEPDFDTPDHVKKAAIRAIDEGFTKYTPVGGIDELKDAIIGKLQRDNQLTYTRAQIVVSCGAKHTLYNLAQVLFEEGDEVVIPSPYWVSYPDIVILTGAKPVILKTKASEGFKIQPAHLEAAIGVRTRAVILNSPSNPSGVAYTAAELEKLADVMAGKGVLVISDDIYEKILYDGMPFANIPSVCPAMKDLTVVVNGLSKSHAMTGWRIGYAAGPVDYRRRYETSESEHVESQLHCPEGFRRGLKRRSEGCDRHGQGIRKKKKRHRGTTQRDSGDHVHGPTGGLLCLSEHCRSARQKTGRQGPDDIGRLGRLSAGRSECGGHSRRRVRS
jgi:aspartate/methionine/tyrosine aminotransferase